MTLPTRGVHGTDKRSTPGASLASTSGKFNTTGGSGSVQSCFVAWNSGTSACSLSSSINGAWTQVGSTVSGTGSSFGALFEFVGGTGGTDVLTATCGAGGAVVISMWFCELLNCKTSSPRETSPAGVDDTSSPYSSNALGPTSQADVTLLAYAATLSASGTEAFDWSGSSFTSFGDPQTNANTDQTGDSAYREVTSTGTYTASLTSSGAGSTAAVVFIVGYKGVPAASTPITGLTYPTTVPGELNRMVPPFWPPSDIPKTKLTPAGVQFVSLPLVTAGATAQAPSVAPGQPLSLPLVTATASPFAPTETQSQPVSLPLATASADAQPPTLAQSQPVSLPLVTATATAQAPSVSGAAQLPLVAASADAQPPTLAQSQPVSLPLDTASADAQPPSTSSGGSASLPLATAGAAPFAPTVVDTQPASLPLVTANAFAYPPRTGNAPVVTGHYSRRTRGGRR